MATGDPADMAQRMAAVLPARWFPPLDDAPVLNAVLTGIGQAWSFCYALIAYARGQARLATATGAFLDMIAADFDGFGLPRHPGESDGSFRVRIAANLRRSAATRAAVTEAVTTLTERAVTLFEPMRPADTGGYAALRSPGCGGGGGYGTVPLRYGSLATPYQIFVDATRPDEGALALAVMGYAFYATAASTTAIGGYGAGAIEYASEAVLDALVTDATIEAAITAALPATCTAWVRLT